MGSETQFPFGDILGPLSSAQDSQNRVSPPLYARQPGFRFDLSCLTNDKESLFLDLARPSCPTELYERSSLDYGQADAIISALLYSFTLIQGPPGTGKSYTG